MFLWLRQLPPCGDWNPASFTSLAEGMSSPPDTPVFPPTSFMLLNFVWFYICFSTGQVLLSALSWCMHALLCRKVYSWWIHGERCTPCSPTPLPSCPPLSHLWSPKPLPCTNFLIYIWKWCLRGKFQSFWWLTQCSWVSHMYTLLNFYLIFCC